MTRVKKPLMSLVVKLQYMSCYVMVYSKLNRLTFHSEMNCNENIFMLHFTTEFKQHQKLQQLATLLMTLQILFSRVSFIALRDGENKKAQM